MDMPRHKVETPSFKVAPLQFKKVSDTNLEKCGTASSLRSSFSRSLWKVPQRPSSAAGKFTSAYQSCSNFTSTSRRSDEGRWQTTDWHAREPIGRRAGLLLPRAGANPAPSVSAFNNNSPNNSNKEHLLRRATSHTHAPPAIWLNAHKLSSASFTSTCTCCCTENFHRHQT